MKQLICLLLLFSLASQAAEPRCEKERLIVENIQDRMRQGYKIGEDLRTKERMAKADYTACMRQPTPSVSGPVKKATKNKGIPPGKTQITQSEQPDFNRFTSYTNFSGAKLKAWQQFYQEPEQCLGKHYEMQTFVACSKARKDALKSFSLHWDDATQTLSPE